MIVGVPKELQEKENRVAITPIGVDALLRRGVKVVIEKSAGEGSGISDREFEKAGAHILPDNVSVYDQADLILKVASPTPDEYSLLKNNQILFSFLFLANNPELTKVLIDKKITAIAYETVECPDGSLPLLTPMSEIGGKMAVQVGAHYLEKSNGGRGILLGGAPGVAPAKVVIIGGGKVGENAARMAIGLGANVTVIEKSVERMRYLEDTFGASITTLMSYCYNIENAVKDADLLIAAIMVAGKKAPTLVTEEMVKTMKKGSVIIDVDIDSGGSIETIDRVCTLENPVFEKHGVIHYAVPNMASTVPCTATYALTNATLPYLLDIVSKGWTSAIKDDLCLAKGVNIANGMVTNRELAKSMGEAYTPLSVLWNYDEEI